LNDTMKVVGLTGGIGMGKSTAAQWLLSRRIAVVDTDDLARQVVEPGRPAWEEIRREFGERLIGSDGKLKREEMARVVFSDPDARLKLERITHPRIRELWMRQIEVWREDGHPLAVVVIPLLFETGSEKCFDCIVCFACSPATQRKRLMERGWTTEQIHQRLAAQWPVNRKMALADYVAWTESGAEVTAGQLERILSRISRS